MIVDNTTSPIMRLTDAIPSSGIAQRTAQKLRHTITFWIKHGGSENPREISTAMCESVRAAASSEHLSATTIERSISDILTLCHYAGCHVEAGRRLRLRVKCKSVPLLESIGRLYDVAEQCNWPSRLRGADWRWMNLTSENRLNWLRGFIALGLWTGLRASDLLKLEWSAIEDERIVIEASKTGKEHRFPLPSILKGLIEPLRALNRATVLGVGEHTLHLIRDELTRLCGVAGIAQIGPQALRRASITTWATVSPEAGRIVHGTGLGVLAHYYDGEQILRAAMDRFPWPSQMLPPELRDARQREQSELLSVLSRLPADRVGDVLRIARAFAG